VSADSAAGRLAFEAGRWTDAYRALAKADADAPLEPEDLERLATAAYLAGEEETSLAARSRAHAAFLARGDRIRAAGSAFWYALLLGDRPDQRAQAAGWIARAGRLLDEAGQPCLEVGWLRCAAAHQRVMAGDVEGARALFSEAVRIGREYRCADLIALARHGEGRTLLALAGPRDGFALIDEVMVSVTGGEVSPVIAGIVYCSVLSACQGEFDLRRAQEWTAAFHAWCTAQPDLVPYRGYCQVRRAELLQLDGAWQQALEEARTACERLAKVARAPELGEAHYRCAEVHRLRGEHDLAEEEYRLASHAGRRPQPGLALLRMAQQRTDAAVAAIQSALGETKSRVGRVPLLHGSVQVMLAAGSVAEARSAADELESYAASSDATFLRAVTASARGAVILAEGRGEDALEHLGLARAAWQDLGVPYEVARVRVLTGLAYRSLGDHDGAVLEFEAAAETFEQLGAVPDTNEVNRLFTPPPTASAGGLTGREIEVLRLVATGATNRAIAVRLGISERTVARHLANIFTKLDLSSRAAATAYAYEQHLV